MEVSVKENWTRIIEFLKDNFDILDILFRTWILPLEVISESDSEVVIAIDESKQGDIKGIIDKKYRIPMQTSIEAITGKKVDISFVSKGVSTREADEGVSSYYNAEDQKTKSLEEKYPFLKSGHSFDNFVVSSSNQLAHAAAVAVAENPNGQIYNPLFLYSGPGLGKTHLMHSISRHIIEHHPEYKLMYTTSENFTNDVVDSLRDNKYNKTAMSNLRDKYRNVDVLLIDDIQFIIDKESTLKEFFHTFEALFQTGKQLVISSDKPPSEMDKLDDRYKTRFSSGLPVDIQPPDYETAMAILRIKQDNSDIKLADEILGYIATNARNSIRELEGAYNRVTLFSRMSAGPGIEITMDMAEEALKDFISDENSVQLSAENIIDIVCNHFNVDKDLLLSERRTDEIAYPRQICMYLCSEYTSLTQQVIAEKLHRKNHTTVNHAVKKIKSDLSVDKELQATISMLKKKLNIK